MNFGIGTVYSPRFHNDDEIFFKFVGDNTL